MTHSQSYLAQVAEIAKKIDHEAVERIVEGLVKLRKRAGRLFILGNGGGAANASHAVSDSWNLCAIEAYSPFDNVAELTAIINDHGWDKAISNWLIARRITEQDAILIFSVGGGDREHNISVNILNTFADDGPIVPWRTSVYSILAMPKSPIGLIAKVKVVIPTVDPTLVTAHTESFQMVILHCIVFHPKLLMRQGKWESLTCPR